MAVLVLAAGASSRMRGADKLLEPVRGIALLRHVAQIALGTGFCVTVALPPNRVLRRKALAGLDLQILEVADADEGIAASLRAGIAALPADHAVLVLLADMPEIDNADLRQMITAYNAAPAMIHRACDNMGRVGHPVIFPPWLRPELLELRGDTGAKALLARHADALRQVVLPQAHATTDLDTPEAWTAWRSTL